MSHPIITVGIKLTPPAVTLGVSCAITISATLSASYPSPITVYSWKTIFNVLYAQSIGIFFCTDLSNNNAPLRLRTILCTKRWSFIDREIGGEDGHLFHTLESGRTIDFTEPFSLSTHLDKALVAGHRYRFGMDESTNQELGYWLLGRREDVLSKPGEDGTLIDWHPGSVELIVQEPIEFEVLESIDFNLTMQKTSGSAG